MSHDFIQVYSRSYNRWYLAQIQLDPKFSKGELVRNSEKKILVMSKKFSISKASTGKNNLHLLKNNQLHFFLFKKKVKLTGLKRTCHKKEFLKSLRIN